MREDIAPFELRVIKGRQTLWLHGEDDENRVVVDKDRTQIIMEAIVDWWDIDIQYAIIKGKLDIRSIADKLEKDDKGLTIVRGNVAIRYSEIRGYVSFSKAIFNNVYFRETTFNSYSLFSKATFNDADFTEVTFNDKVYFKESTFNRYSFFSEATFNDKSYFNDAVFLAITAFGYIHFSKHVNLAEANLDNVSPESLDSIGDAYVRSSIRGAHYFFQIAGDRYWNNGKYQEAANSFRNAKIEYDKECKYDESAIMFKNVGERYLNLKNYILAENCFREARMEYDKDGNYREAGNMYVMEKQSIRKASPIGKKILYLIWETSCNYGESHWRFIAVAIIIILSFAFIYLPLMPDWWIFPITYLEYPFNSWFGHGNVINNIIDGIGSNILTAIYYSVVTFATLGFGDITPFSGAGKLWVIFEVMCGYVMLGILITLVARKMTRS